MYVSVELVSLVIFSLTKEEEDLEMGYYLLDGLKNRFDEFARLMAYSYSTLMVKGSKIIVF